MANNEFIEVLSENAIKDIRTLNRELTKTVAVLNKANEAAKGLKIPSDFRAALNDLNSIIRQSNQLLRQQITLQQQLAGTTQTNTNATINAERAEQQRLRTEQQRLRLSEQQRRAAEAQARSAERERAIAERLGSAYLQLSRAQSQAARRVQDLIAAGRQGTQTQREYDRELRTAQREFDRLNARVLAADRAVGRFNRNVGNYPTQAIRGIRDLIGAFGIVGGVTAFAMIAKDIFNTTKQIQSMNLALRQVTGSQQAFEESSAFLSNISEKYGLGIMELTRSYTNFYASAKDKLAASEINGIFESIGKAAGIMGLSVEQQEGAFLALSQMLSKGTIQAEEIRGQLAERLPGAFGILAKSMGVTEQQLNKLLKDGKVLAAEVLPAFAKELERAYGIENINRAESLAASTTRLGNAWKSFVEQVSDGDSIITKSLIGITNALSGVLTGFERLAESEEDRQKRLEKSAENDYYNQEIKYLKTLTDLEERRDYAAFNIEFNQKTWRKLFRERQKLYEQQEELEQKLSGEGLLSGLSPYQQQLDEVNDKISKNLRVSAAISGERRADLETLKGETKAEVELGEKKAKRQKADIDYLREVYQLRRTNADAQIEYEERIMNDEEKNYDKRLEAANNYYFQKKQLLELDRQEQLRLNDLEYKNQVENYKKAIAEGQATNSNLQELEYRHILVKKRINADYEKNKSSLAIESAKKLQGVLADIQDQSQRNLLSQQAIKDLQQVGLLLDNVGGNTSIRQFTELENKMREIAASEEDRQIQGLEIDLRRVQADKERLKNQEGLIQDNKKYNDLSKQEYDLQRQILDVRNKQKQAVADLYKEMATATQEYLNTFSEGFLQDAGLGSLTSMFDQVEYEVVNSLGEIEKKSGSTFQKLFDQAQSAGAKFAVVFNTITSVAKEAFAFLQQEQEYAFDAMYGRLEREKEINLKFAGESESGRAEIERQYEAKRREIRIKEAKAQKEQALFNIILNTAQGVTAALASVPPNVPLSLVIGAIGAAQLAMVAGREIPAYAEGVQGHGGGLAWVGDGGRSEIIQTPSGGLYRTPATDTLVNLPKGSNVYKDDLDFIRNSGALFGGVPHIELEGGSLTEAQMRAIMQDALSGSASFNVSLDKKGVNSWASTAHAKKMSHNNRVSFRGRSIN